MKIVCLDTMVTLHCFPRPGRPATNLDSSDLFERGKALLDICRAEGTKILVPSVVVAELLFGVPEENQSTFLSVLQTSCIVPAFDVKAALLLARLWRANLDMRKYDRAFRRKLEQAEVSREILKADCLIVATALANGAECLYSQDKGLELVCDGNLAYRWLRDVPIPAEQGEFWADSPETG